MTYEHLGEIIAKMTPEQRRSDLTIVDVEMNEAFGNVNLSFVKLDSKEYEDIGLDENLPFLAFNLPLNE